MFVISQDEYDCGALCGHSVITVTKTREEAQALIEILDRKTSENSDIRTTEVPDFGKPAIPEEI